MQVRAQDLVSLLRKIDEIQDKAQAASGTGEGLAEALAGLAELRQMAYGLLGGADECQPPVVFPIVEPYPWWQRPYEVTCGSSVSSEG